MFQHNSHKAFFRTPAGPAPAGSQVTIRFLSDESDSVVLRIWSGEEITHVMHPGEDNVWSAQITMPEEPGWVWYDFILYQKNGRVVRYGNAYDQLGGEGAVYETGDVASYQITVYKPGFKTPGFFQGANIYQILPDRFFRAPTKSVDDRTDRLIHQDWNEPLRTDTDPRCKDYNSLEFYGGTLTGITKKLPYLAKLGVTVLYLNPIFRSYSNHRYDTGDYMQIDPLLGTQAEFDALCKQAGELGIRVLMDGVFSHTGADSRYFNRYGTYDTQGACQSKDSPWYDWYTFRSYPDDYACWWDFPSLPEVHKDNESYQKFMFQPKQGVIPHWLHAGAAGWRLDVADELPMDFLRQLRTAAKRAKRDAVVLGEVWEDASNKIAYGKMRNYCTGDTLDSVMNYPLREALLDFASGQQDAYALARLLEHQAEVYPAPFRYALMNLVGSHDRARALNVLCGKEGKELTREEQRELTLTPEEYALAVERYKLCLDILCAIPGNPTIYYGDEAGLTGCADPFCRKPYPWGKEDKALQQYVADKLNRRKSSNLLKYGHCEISCPDADTLKIVRYLDGTDALGRKAGKAREEFTFTRKG